MAVDIGEMLFVNILQMNQYPGQPFTGNIFQDLILFLIVPTIFIIMIIYTMAGRMAADKKIRIMLGVGAYLFIVASGYYAAFALLSGPYFIFLIFILGVVSFLAGHFKGGGPGYSSGGGYSNSSGSPSAQAEMWAEQHMPSKVKVLLGVDQELNPANRALLEKQLKMLIQRRDAIMAHGRPEKEALVRLDDINTQIFMIKGRLGKA